MNQADADNAYARDLERLRAFATAFTVGLTLLAYRFVSTRLRGR
jgi:hypothetical protein